MNTTESLVIRKATIGDAEVVSAIIRAAFAEHARLDPPSSAEGDTPERVRERFVVGDVALADLDGTPVGCVFFEPRDGYMYFGRLAVLPEHRGRGVSGPLIAYVEQEAREQGFARIQISVRLALPQMRARYERLGYRVIEERTHPGYSAPTYVVMEKEF